jgi:Transposase DDE domain
MRKIILRLVQLCAVEIQASSAFSYQPADDTYRCPGEKTLRRKTVRQKELSIIYEAAPNDCSTCTLKPSCTTSQKRGITRHLYEDSLRRMHEQATPPVMRLRRSTVEHPFGTIKYRIFGHPRLLMRGLSGARVETSLAIMAYNLKRMTNVLRGNDLIAALRPV